MLAFMIIMIINSFTLLQEQSAAGSECRFSPVSENDVDKLIKILLRIKTHVEVKLRVAQSLFTARNLDFANKHSAKHN